MRITTKGRYAVTAMIDLAFHKGELVSLSDISKRQGISLSYLEQLFSKLRNYNLVISVRGPGGGYKLSRNLSQIHLAQVVDAVNDSFDATGCNGNSDCNFGNLCLTHYLWRDISFKIKDLLSNISLADLVARQDIKDIAITKYKLINT